MDATRTRNKTNLVWSTNLNKDKDNSIQIMFGKVHTSNCIYIYNVWQNVYKLRKYK